MQMTRRTVCFLSLFLSLICFSQESIFAQTDRAQLLQEMIALREQLKVTSDPLQIIALNAQFAQKEVLFLQPAAEDYAAAANTLTQPETGVMRILPRGKYEDILLTRGAGAYYYFPQQIHEYGYGSDLELQLGQFSVGFAGADFGFLTSLNNVALDSVKLDTPGVKYLADFTTPLNEPGAREQQQRASAGFQADGFNYRNRVAAALNTTYVVRSIVYEGSDCLVAFRVIRQDSFDDSLIILWKMLKRYATPQLNGGVVANVTGANYTRPALAPESIVSGFGTDIANDTVIATDFPLPTSLGGVSVTVFDSQRIGRSARIFAVTKGQANFQIPANTAIGPAIISIRTAGGKSLDENVRITTTAPGIFTATSDGQGIAAAISQRVRGELSTYESVVQFDSAQNKFVAVPIDLGPEIDRVYLLLYTSGVRFRKNLASVKVTIGGIEATVEYAGPQCCFVGVDQINALIPRSLIGKGDVDVTLSVDGVVANTVRVNIK